MAAESGRAIFEGMVVVVIGGFLSVNRVLCVVSGNSLLATLAWQSPNDRFDQGLTVVRLPWPIVRMAFGGYRRAHLLALTAPLLYLE